MPFSLFLPILLRLSGPMAFVFAAILAGILNRSVAMIPLLALAATATTLLIRRYTPSPALNLETLLKPDNEQAKPDLFQGMAKRLFAGLIGYAAAFGMAALIAALFQATEFEAQLQAFDVWLLAVPALLAFAGAWFSARLGLNQMANLMGEFRNAFEARNAASDLQGDEAFTVEGEVLDKDDPKS